MNKQGQVSSGNARAGTAEERSAAKVNAEFESAVQEMVREREGADRKRQSRPEEDGIRMTKAQAEKLAEAMESVKKHFPIEKIYTEYYCFSEILFYLAGYLQNSSVPYSCAFRVAEEYFFLKPKREGKQ